LAFDVRISRYISRLNEKVCSFARLFAKLPHPGDRKTWASAAGAGEPWPPWIFIHDTDIVDGARLNSAIFRFFCYFLVFFSFLPWKRLK